MKINANSLKIGNVIEYQNQLWVISKREHTMPGKGGAFIQVEIKNIVTNTKSNVRFRSSEDVKRAYLEQKPLQFQYMDGDELVAMDMQSYEQFNFKKELVVGDILFLQEGIEIIIDYCNNKAIMIHLPENITLEVSQADAVIKGQTASSSYKPAILENGVRVMVPPFISNGDKIVVRCEDATYLERAKK
jgi:elongation factor P